MTETDSNLNPIENLTDEDLDKFYLTIGQNVKNLRKKHKISQLKLSQLLNQKSASQVAGAEILYRGEKFNLDTLYKIAYIFNINVEDLIKEDQTFN